MGKGAKRKVMLPVRRLAGGIGHKWLFVKAYFAGAKRGHQLSSSPVRGERTIDPGETRVPRPPESRVPLWYVHPHGGLICRFTNAKPPARRWQTS